MTAGGPGGRRWGLAPVPEAARLRPYALRCDHRDRPLGIDTSRPRLSWRLTSARRGDRPAAYRVRVSACAGMDQRPVPVWDTGWTAGDATSEDYGGPPLVSVTRYVWRVDVRSAWHDASSPGDVPGPGGISGESASAESWFETGIMHPGEWTARWIEHDPEREPGFRPPASTAEPRTQRTARLEPPRYLRRSVRLRHPVTRARVLVTAHGIYQLRINGRRVGADELTPGWTDYRSRVCYQCYDVGDLLAVGENVLGAIIADGWWSGSVGWDTRHQAWHYGRRPQLLLQLIAEHPDGSRSVVSTDAAWRDSAGPLRYADLLMGEFYDATKQMCGWDAPGYDDTSWAPVKVAGTDTSTLAASLTEPVRVTEDIHPEEIRRYADGRIIVDFGQNIAGRIRLTVRGIPAGTRISIRHAEALDGDGELYTANLRTAEATDHYVAGGRPAEVFEPCFTVHGFRYAEISGHPGGLTAADITGRVLHSDTQAAGEFSCSDPAIVKLMSNIRWSQRGNFVSVPTDCPQRDERLGWTADAQVFLPTACYSADVISFFTNWLADLAAGQAPDGAFTDVAPHLLTEHSAAPGWGDAGTLIPWHLYRVYGDERILSRTLPNMIRWVEFIRSHNPDLIWRHRAGRQYGDWLQVAVETPHEVLATAYFARSAQIVAAAAGVLGETGTARRHADLAARIAAAFTREFVSPDGTITGDTQTAYLLALAFDLLPAKIAPRAVRRLVGDLERRGRSLTTGFIGVSLICPVLARYGHADIAYDLLHDDRCPSWGYAVKHGATTVWERWDGWTEEGGFGPAAMNSFNHYALGSVGAWLYSGVAGIDQAAGSVAFRRLLIRPRPGGRLRWASASYDTPLGRVSSGWELTGQRLRLSVQVPPGATATVHVPTDDPSSVREGGRPLADAAGVRVLCEGERAPGEPADNEHGADEHDVGERAARCRVTSGRYEFTAEYQG